HLDKVEGGCPTLFMRYLRHECGHAFDHAYGISGSREFRAVFGDPDLPYDPDHFLDRSSHPDFARNLSRWYGQTHPCEDFAETFDVWLRERAHRRPKVYISKKLELKFSFIDKSYQRYAGKPLRFNRSTNLMPYRKIRHSVRHVLDRLSRQQISLSCRAE